MDLECICKDCKLSTENIEFQSLVQVQTPQGIMQGISTRVLYDCPKWPENMLRHEFGVISKCTRFVAKVVAADKV